MILSTTHHTTKAQVFFPPPTAALHLLSLISRSKLSPDASPQKIINTLRLPSGVGATCTLKTPFNSTLDQLAQTLNPSANNSKTLAARYFDSMCLDSFTQGVPLSNFVPPPPSPAPSDDPDLRFEDGLWNFTVASPTRVHGWPVFILTSDH